MVLPNVPVLEAHSCEVDCKVQQFSSLYKRDSV